MFAEVTQLSLSGVAAFLIPNSNGMFKWHEEVVYSDLKHSKDKGYIVFLLLENPPVFPCLMLIVFNRYLFSLKLRDNF